MLYRRALQSSKIDFASFLIVNNAPIRFGGRQVLLRNVCQHFKSVVDGIVIGFWLLFKFFRFLRGPRKSVVLADSEAVRGMIRKVSHLVTVEPAD